MQTPDQPRKRRVEAYQGPSDSRRRFAGDEGEGGSAPFQLKLEQTEEHCPLARSPLEQTQQDQPATSGGIGRLGGTPPPAAAAGGRQQDAADQQDAGKQVLAAAKAWVASRPQPSLLFPKVMTSSMVNTPGSGFWLQAPLGLQAFYGTTKRLLRLHCDDSRRDPVTFRHTVPRTTTQWEVMYLPRASSSSRSRSRAAGSSDGASRGGGRSDRGGGRSNRGGGRSSRGGGRTGGGQGLSGGWRGFAIDQELQVNDVVVLEVLDQAPAAGDKGGWWSAAAAAAAAGAAGPLPEQRMHMGAHIFRVADYEDLPPPPQPSRRRQQQEQPPADMPATPALLPVAGSHRSRVKLEQPDFDAAVEAEPATAAAGGGTSPDMQAGAGAMSSHLQPQAPDAVPAQAAATGAGPCCHMAARAASSDSVIIVSDSSDSGAAAPPPPLAPAAGTAAAPAPATATASTSSVVIVDDAAGDGQEVQGALSTPPAAPAAAAVAAATTGPAQPAAAALGRRSLAAALAAADAAALPAGFGLSPFSSLPEAVLQLQQLLDVLGPAVQAALLGQLEAAAEALRGFPPTHERMLAFRTSYGFVRGWVRVGNARNAQRALEGLLGRVLE